VNGPVKHIEGQERIQKSNNTII